MLYCNERKRKTSDAEGGIWSAEGAGLQVKQGIYGEDNEYCFHIWYYYRFFLLLACGYCALVRKKEIWLICLYIFVFWQTWDTLHFLLSVSYVAGELLLLFLYGVLQDYEIAEEL